MKGRAAIFLIALFAGADPPTAEATFPGTNGMVVFSSRNFVNESSYDLHMAFGDGELERTVAVTPAVSEVRPAWSPDGETIAYDAMVSGQYDVYTTRFDGTEVRQITTNPADEGDAAWSPDGQHIAFTSSRSGAFALCLINADGTGESCLIDSAGQPIQGRAPSWSPDGQRLAVRERGGDLDREGGWHGPDPDHL
jgi:TolB protein